MRIFITGATGFIGSHVAFRLLASGHDLVVLARNPSKLVALRQHERVRFVHATLMDLDVLRRGVEGCDACVHVALGWGDTPTDMLRADTLPTVALAQATASSGVKRFLYTSSTAALGEFSPRMDERCKASPVDYYGATKAASEAYVLAIDAQTDMACNVLRPGYTFGNPVVEGADMQSDSRFADIVRRALAGEDIELDRDDGTQFVSAGDLARLYEAILGSSRRGETYFGLGHEFVSWEKIARRAVGMLRSPSQVVLRGSGGAPNLFDLSKIERHFGLRFHGVLPQIEAHLRHLVDAERAR